MARDSRYDILFTPIKIGPKIAKNRFYQVPHCDAMGYGEHHGDIAHRRMKAGRRMGRHLHRAMQHPSELLRRTLWRAPTVE